MRGREIVGWNLRRLRVAAGVSQERLAFDAGMDRSYVGGLERGEENPTIDLLERLAETLKCKLADFTCEPETDAEPPAVLRPGRRPK
jgi:transcriptional regulator with XRE-family HTH domain